MSEKAEMLLQIVIFSRAYPLQEIEKTQFDISRYRYYKIA